MCVKLLGDSRNFGDQRPYMYQVEAKDNGVVLTTKIIIVL